MAASTNSSLFSLRPVHVQEPWTRGEGSKSPVQAWFESYNNAVNAGDYKTVPLTKWYSPKAIFYAQNGTVYHGATEIGEWMRGPVFGGFARVDHSAGAFYDITPSKGEEEGGDSTIIFHTTRHVWLPGTDVAGAPDVSVPMLWVGKVGPADSDDAFDGLQHKEVHLSWDTAKVAQLMRERGLGPYQGVQ